MSSPGVELVTAWVRLVPTMEGATENVVKALAPGTKAAEAEGEKAGKGWSSKAKAAMAVGGAAAVAGTVAAFKGLYDIGSTFDDVTDTIRVGTGAQGAALDGLVETAKQVGLKVPAEFGKIGPTVADLNTRLGLSGKTLETVASQYLEAGRILGQDVDINATSAAFSAFRIEGDAVVGAMDDLFRVSQATGVGMNDLASGVQANAPALQNLGFGFQDSIALLGSLDKAGLNSTQVMASLSKGLVTLAKEGEQPQEAFRRVSSEIQGFIDEGNTAAALDLASKVFGTRGASQFVGALQSGVLNMNDLMAATGATGDTILGVGEETMDFAERWQMTMNTAMTALEPLATAVFTALGDGLTAAMPMLQALGAWVGENVGVIGVIAAVIGGTLVAAFVAWTASIWASTVALLANPITWVVLLIAGLIAAIVALVLNWDHVVKWITDVWNGFVAWLGDVWNGFVTWITDVWKGFLSWLSGVMSGFVTWWNGLWTGIGDFLRGLWDGIVAFFQAALDWIVNLFLNWTVYGLIMQHWDAIAGFFQDIWNGITRFIGDAIQNVANVIGSVTQGIANIWNGIWSGIGQFFSDVWNGILNAVWTFGGVFNDVFGGIAGFVSGAFSSVVDTVAGAVNGIIGLVNGAIDGLNSISVDIPDWVPLIGGQHWGLSIPSIPYLAKGATILPRPGGTVAVLAEAGRPESVVDTGLMNRALEEGIAGNGQSAATVQGPLVHVDQLIVDSDRRVDEVAQELYERAERAKRAGGRVNLGGAVTE
ncbi:phage tail tape measure protein [Microbacterium resistens]|uniref:Phage tail tape measure protein n=1 Tax=Microbacterium resistens TaxID=156977 RepID=A0ABY3RSQ0_9MICO|nr:phage tail tape measure protein [Microbacterium resistens]UGS26320.1 phage tail tape measure protein [Microbacterium resistens]